MPWLYSVENIWEFATSRFVFVSGDGQFEPPPLFFLYGCGPGLSVGDARRFKNQQYQDIVGLKSLAIRLCKNR